MEKNMTTALLIAGSVLIGILIITVGVMTFRTSANFAVNYEKKIDNLQIQAFNSKIEKYTEKVNKMTIQDVLSLLNLCKNLNSQGVGYNIHVFREYENADLTNEYKNMSMEDFIDKYFLDDSNNKKNEAMMKANSQENKFEIYYYNAEIKERDTDGKITKILIKKVTDSKLVPKTIESNEYHN